MLAWLGQKPTTSSDSRARRTTSTRKMMVRDVEEAAEAAEGETEAAEVAEVAEEEEALLEKAEPREKVDTGVENNN